MAPEEHRPDVRVLIDQVVLLQNAVDPSRHGGPGLAHHARREAAFEPFKVDVPDATPVLERTLREAVVTRQRVGVRTDVGRALYVVMATIDVGPAARHADVAEGELEDAARADDRVAVGMQI